MENKAKTITNFFKYTIITTLIIFAFYLINTYGINQIRDEVANMGVFAPILLFLLRFTSVIIPALPSTAYSLLAGGLLGFKKGLLIICLSDLLSCSTSFYIARRYGKPAVQKLAGRQFISRIEELGSNHIENNFFLMTGLLMTGLFDFISYGIGLTKTAWRKYYPALIISIVLSNPPIVALGAGILEGGYKILVFSALGIFVLSIIASKTRRNFYL